MQDFLTKVSIAGTRIFGGGISRWFEWEEGPPQGVCLVKMIRPSPHMLVCGVQDSGSAYVFRRDLDAPQLHTSSLIHSCMFLAQWGL